jgi:CHASE2 domain-containing sensor protein
MSDPSNPALTTDDRSAPVARGQGVKDKDKDKDDKEKPEEGKPGLKQALKDIVSWKTLVVLAAMALWAYNFRWVEDQFPFLVTAQLKFHQALSNLDWQPKRADRVTLVQIDDASFWSPPLSGTLPTNRTVLGDLGLLAAEHGAALVAFDIQLDAPTAVGTDDAVRKPDNDHLLDAIRKIAGSKTPVVLAIDLDPDEKKGGWLREPSIFRDDQLPALVGMGYINLPFDPRQIPLASTAWDVDGKSKVPVRSFALAIVDALEKATHVLADDQTEKKAVITESIANNEFVYGGFLRNDKWDKVTAKQLLQGDQDGLEKCRGRVVIVGSTWHESWGRGDMADEHRSPLGSVAGVYLHGNYVEALLRNDFRPGVREGIAVAIDLGIAVLFYVLFRSAKKGVARVGVLLTFVFLGLVAYLAFANIGVYFDFIAPVSLVFVHLLVEVV